MKAESVSSSINWKNAYVSMGVCMHNYAKICYAKMQGVCVGIFWANYGGDSQQVNILGRNFLFSSSVVATHSNIVRFSWDDSSPVIVD